MVNIGPVGIVMEKRKERETDKCPRSKESESNLHILTCAGSGTDAIFSNAIETVQEWLEQGPSQFALTITELIHTHRNQNEPQWYLIEDFETQQVMQHQRAMGKVSMIWDFFHTDWKNVIDEHLHGTRRSSARWLSILSSRIWNVTESMWLHRNEIVHGIDKNNLLSHDRHETLNGEIDQIYT